MSRFARGLLGLALIVPLMASAVFIQPAGADIIVTPKRVILDDKENSAIFRCFNSSAEVKRYQITWRQLRMNATGGLVEDKSKNPAGASSALVRVSPRVMTLQPGETQIVRVSTRQLPNLPTGEYISHMTFAPKAVASKKKQPTEPVQNLGLELKVNLGVSVPVIVRRGGITSSAKIKALGLGSKPLRLNLEISRTGRASTFGNVELYWRANKGSNDQVPVGRLNGVAVYANIKARSTGVPIVFPDGKPKAGIITMIFRDPESNQILAQNDVQLQ